MGIDININGLNNNTTSQGELSDSINHIDIYIDGLKTISSTFLKLTDTPSVYENGKFLQCSTDGIIYTSVDWESIQDDIASLTSRISDIEDNFQDIESDFSALETSVALLMNAEIRPIKNRLTTAENNISSVQDDIIAINDDIVNINSEINRCKDRLDIIESDILSLKREVNTLNTSIHGGTALSETALPYQNLD